MAIAPWGRAKARREAPLHLQLELTNVPAHCPESVVPIRGRVVTVFRGQALAALGSVIEFPVWVCSRDKVPTGPAFIEFASLMGATHIELYLYGTPPECKLAAYEYELLGAPSATPVLSATNLEPSVRGRESPGRRRWWHLW
jgi:hypothetical protein